VVKPLGDVDLCPPVAWVGGRDVARVTVDTAQAPHHLGHHGPVVAVGHWDWALHSCADALRGDTAVSVCHRMCPVAQSTLIAVAVTMAVEAPLATVCTFIDVTLLRWEVAQLTGVAFQAQPLRFGYILRIMYGDVPVGV